MCMIGYLFVKDCKEEAFTCLVIFLASILLIVVNYQPVFVLKNEEEIDRSSISELNLKNQVE